MQNSMLKASLAMHTPQAIYEFFQKKIGPLTMTLKEGYAIIQFDNQAQSQRVVNVRYPWIIEGFPLCVSFYKEGDIQRQKQQEQERKRQRKIRQKILQYIDLSKVDSVNLRNVNDRVEGLIARSKNQISSFLKGYEFLNERVLERNIGLEKDYPQSSLLNEKRLGLKKTVINKMKDAKKRLEFGLEHLCQEVENFGSRNRKMQIATNQQNTLICSQPDFLVKSSVYKFEDNALQIKKIVQIDQQRFAVSSLIQVDEKNPIGKLNIFHNSSLQQYTSIPFKQGAYGLAKFGRYLLVGNWEGTISYLNIGELEESQKQVSKQLHEAMIYEIGKFLDKGSEGYIVTLAADQIVRMWKVEQEQITPEIYNLGFSSLGSEKTKKANTIQTVEGSNYFYMGSSKAVFTYDLEKNQITGVAKTQEIVHKISALSANILAVATGQTISIIDCRINALSKAQTIGKELKSLCSLDDNYIQYGAISGELGIVDRRKMNGRIWNNFESHKNSIYDIKKFGNRVLTGDRSGVLVGWDRK